MHQTNYALTILQQAFQLNDQVDCVPIRILTVILFCHINKALAFKEKSSIPMNAHRIIFSQDFIFYCNDLR